jgi:hypothetical protein
LNIEWLFFFDQFVPESPRFFVASGYPEKAEHVLKKIALTNKRALPPGKLLDVNARVRLITKEIFSK